MLRVGCAHVSTSVAAKLPSFGGAEPICSADLHPLLPPLSALLPTSSLNYRPLTFDLGGGGRAPLFSFGGGGMAPKLSMARRHWSTSSSMRRRLQAGSSLKWSH